VKVATKSAKQNMKLNIKSKDEEAVEKKPVVKTVAKPALKPAVKKVKPKLEKKSMPVKTAEKPENKKAGNFPIAKKTTISEKKEKKPQPVKEEKVEAKVETKKEEPRKTEVATEEPKIPARIATQSVAGGELKKTRKDGEYTAKDIYVLKGLEPVRQRPGMYIGSTGVDGLHHLIWEVVDNSLTHQTPILIKENGETKLIKIGELIDSRLGKSDVVLSKDTAEIARGNLDIEALSFDPADLKLKFRPVASLIRHKVNSDIFRITLQNGRQIEITPYHSLFTLKQGEVLPIKGADLKIGSPVIVPKIWPQNDSPVEGIDLVDRLLMLPDEKTESIYLYNIKRILNEKVAQELKPALCEWASKRQACHYSNILGDFKRYDYLPFNFLRRLSKESINLFKENSLIGTKYNEKVRLNSKLTLSRELVELMGVFAAEGSIVKNSNVSNRVVFSLGSHEKELIEYTCRLIKSVFKFNARPHYVHKTARTIAIDSYLVALIFKEILKTGENCDNKKVPDLIFNLDEYLRQRYLIAYMSGDGYPTKVWIKHLVIGDCPSEFERRKFTAVAKTKNFVSSLAYLLSSLNKTYSFGERKRKEEKRFISITYNGLKKMSELKSEAISYAVDFYWNTNSSYINYLPTKETISWISWKRPYSFSLDTNGGVSAEKISTLLAQNRIKIYPPADKFLLSDLGILKVTKIEKIEYEHPWVYDISVPGGENFVGGYSPIIAHNCLDEAMAGYAKNIEVVLLSNNRVMISDDGRGIPVEKHKDTKKSALETVMTTLHAGGKFGGDAYKVSGGLHGVGISVVCALSTYMLSEVHRDGGIYQQEYFRGKPKTQVQKTGSAKDTGTIQTFEADPEIFKEIKYDSKKILKHLRQQAYLTKGVKIIFRDERPARIGYAEGVAGGEKGNPSTGSGQGTSYAFYFEGGVASYVKYLVEGNTPRHQTVFSLASTKEDIFVETAFQYTQEMESMEESFANNIYTPEGGTHVSGFRAALTRSLNDYARRENFLKEKDDNFSGDDVREGLTTVISVKIKTPQFEGQTKAKLGNPEAKNAVETAVAEGLADYLERNPSDARAIIENCLLATKARLAAKAARQTVLRKGALEGLALPGKLADCLSRKPEESELYIVEGDSAGGSSKMARDRRFQAILPLRGKILNVERARLDKMLASKEIKALIIAMGAGIGEDFNLEKLRYHRIVIMTDADVDGAHIRTLLLTFFYRHFKPVVDAGRIYIAQPPLYKIQAGKRVEYAYSDDQRDKIVKDIGKASGISIQRYKGLGEMNPEQLWETTMNPENRTLLQVAVEEAREADKTFDILMGEQVEPRKKFIQTHAKLVKSLDI